MSSLWSLRNVSLPGRASPRLDCVSVEIPAGVTAILGQSGAGKTSLLNVLVGFERPATGTVQGPVAAGPAAGAMGSLAADRLPFFWSPPSHGLWSHLTAFEHLSTVSPDRDRAKVAGRLLEAFDLTLVGRAKPGSLSLGEQSRLSLARAIASGARILVLDEPLAHVDTARVGKYWTVLRQHCQATSTSLVMATHSPEVVLREATHALCLRHGQVFYAGTVQDLYDHPSSEELAAMLGPGNWVSAGDRHWIDGLVNSADACCIRPERLSLTSDSNGPAQVEAARFAGAVAEVDLVDARTGDRRTFQHRPAGPRLRAGDRVALKILLLLIAVLCAGCGSGAGPALNVKEETYWFMPPDGPRIPAPRGMTISRDGEYLVLDNAGRILVFDENGTLTRKWWMPDYAVGKPEGVCVLKDGRIAVADTHYHRVVFFDHEGNVVGMFGKLGTAPGEFIYPVSVVQDDKENLYICEYGNFNDRAQKFRPDGTFVCQIGSYGTEDGQFQRPSGAAWFQGRVYIVDAFNNRVQVFDEDGKLIEILGNSDRISELYYPYDISVSEQGEIYVVEYGAGRVSKFNRSGKLVGRYGRPGRGTAELTTPWGLAVDRRGRVYVCDTGNRRIVELRM